MFKRFVCAGTSHEHTRVFIPDLCKVQSINRQFSRETFRVLNLAEQSDWLIFLRKNGILQCRMHAMQNRGEGFNVPWLFQYTNLSSHIICKPFLQKKFRLGNVSKYEKNSAFRPNVCESFIFPSSWCPYFEGTDDPRITGDRILQIRLRFPNI